ncbi:putative reverse transcriptase domain-containing protein, partial [Tanacetum coccineum]
NANVVADVLSRKERIKPRPVRVMSMTIYSGIKTKLLEAQRKASKDLKALEEMMRGLDVQFKRKDDGGLYFMDPIWISLSCNVRTLIMDEAHTSKYFVHPGADKMYYDLRDLYWCSGMKKDIARLTKSAHFLSILEEYKMEKLARIYINEIMTLQKALGTQLDMSMAYHPQTDGQSVCTFQTLEDMLRACVIDFGGSWDTHLPLVEFSCNNKTTEKIIQIKERLKTTRDHQKSYADKRHKPLEFNVGDHVLLKIVERVSPVAYRLRLPRELSSIHDMFHVSNLKKCLAYASLQVSLEEIEINDILHFIEEPIEIVDREVNKLKRGRIPIVKVR